MNGLKATNVFFHLQNYHEFIHSNLLSDSGFSIISIVEFQRNQKQKIGVVLIVKAANGEKIMWS